MNARSDLSVSDADLRRVGGDSASPGAIYRDKIDEYDFYAYNGLEHVKYGADTDEARQTKLRAHKPLLIDARRAYQAAMVRPSMARRQPRWRMAP